MKLSPRFLSCAGLLTLALVTISVPATSFAETLNRQLDLGMTGADVTVLQVYLATDATLYPRGLVTGYFGSLTGKAVALFQTRNGLASVGRVGPATLPLLNSKMSGAMVNGYPANEIAPTITSVGVSVNRNSATINWNTDEAAQGRVYYSMNPLTTYENPVTVDVSGDIASTDNNYRSSQYVTINNLRSDTVYYYLIYVTDQSGNVSVVLPATFRTQQ
jgi:peptidoglycan hydrolase-like protein with peptidoglycan-binding domain